MTLLKVLLLDGCRMNDASVQVLVSCCQLLREVSIKGSVSCSDKSAELLLQVFVSLFAMLLPALLYHVCV